MFWDARTKELVSKIRGHDGVVCWVDTCAKIPGSLVSAGLDGTVRIWMDEPEDEHEDGLNGLKLEPNDDMDEVMRNGDDEQSARFDDTPRERSLSHGGSVGGTRYRSEDRMED